MLVGSKMEFLAQCREGQDGHVFVLLLVVGGGVFGRQGGHFFGTTSGV